MYKSHNLLRLPLHLLRDLVHTSPRTLLLAKSCLPTTIVADGGNLGARGKWPTMSLCGKRHYHHHHHHLGVVSTARKEVFCRCLMRSSATLSALGRRHLLLLDLARGFATMRIKSKKSILSAKGLIMNKQQSNQVLCIKSGQLATAVTGRTSVRTMSSRKSRSKSKSCKKRSKSKGKSKSKSRSRSNSCKFIMKPKKKKQKASGKKISIEECCRYCDKRVRCALDELAAIVACKARELGEGTEDEPKKKHGKKRSASRSGSAKKKRSRSRSNKSSKSKKSSKSVCKKSSKKSTKPKKSSKSLCKKPSKKKSKKSLCKKKSKAKKAKSSPSLNKQHSKKSIPVNILKKCKSEADAKKKDPCKKGNAKEKGQKKDKPKGVCKKRYTKDLCKKRPSKKSKKNLCKKKSSKGSTKSKSSKCLSKKSSKGSTKKKSSKNIGKKKSSTGSMKKKSSKDICKKNTKKKSKKDLCKKKSSKGSMKKKSSNDICKKPAKKKSKKDLCKKKSSKDSIKKKSSKDLCKKPSTKKSSKDLCKKPSKKKSSKDLCKKPSKKKSSKDLCKKPSKKKSKKDICKKPSKKKSKKDLCKKKSSKGSTKKKSSKDVCKKKSSSGSMKKKSSKDVCKKKSSKCIKKKKSSNDVCKKKSSKDICKKKSSKSIKKKKSSKDICKKPSKKKSEKDICRKKSSKSMKKKSKKDICKKKSKKSVKKASSCKLDIKPKKKKKKSKEKCNKSEQSIGQNEYCVLPKSGHGAKDKCPPIPCNAKLKKCPPKGNIKAICQAMHKKKGKKDVKDPTALCKANAKKNKDKKKKKMKKKNGKTCATPKQPTLKTKSKMKKPKRKKKDKCRTSIKPKKTKKCAGFIPDPVKVECPGKRNSAGVIFKNTPSLGNVGLKKSLQALSMDRISTSTIDQNKRLQSKEEFIILNHSRMPASEKEVNPRVPSFAKNLEPDASKDINECHKLIKSHESKEMVKESFIKLSPSASYESAKVEKTNSKPFFVPGTPTMLETKSLAKDFGVATHQSNSTMKNPTKIETKTLDDIVWSTEDKLPPRRSSIPVKSKICDYKILQEKKETQPGQPPEKVVNIKTKTLGDGVWATEETRPRKFLDQEALESGNEVLIRTNGQCHKTMLNVPLDAEKIVLEIDLKNVSDGPMVTKITTSPNHEVELEQKRDLKDLMTEDIRKLAMPSDVSITPPPRAISEVKLYTLQSCQGKHGLPHEMQRELIKYIRSMKGEKPNTLVFQAKKIEDNSDEVSSKNVDFKPRKRSFHTESLVRPSPRIVNLPSKMLKEVMIDPYVKSHPRTLQEPAGDNYSCRDPFSLGKEMSEPCKKNPVPAIDPFNDLCGPSLCRDLKDKTYQDIFPSGKPRRKNQKDMVFQADRCWPGKKKPSFGACCHNVPMEKPTFAACTEAHTLDDYIHPKKKDTFYAQLYRKPLPIDECPTAINFVEPPSPTSRALLKRAFNERLAQQMSEQARIREMCVQRMRDEETCALESPEQVDYCTINYAKLLQCNKAKPAANKARQQQECFEELAVRWNRQAMLRKRRQVKRLRRPVRYTDMPKQGTLATFMDAPKCCELNAPGEEIKPDYGYNTKALSEAPHVRRQWRERVRSTKKLVAAQQNPKLKVYRDVTQRELCQDYERCLNRFKESQAGCPRPPMCNPKRICTCQAKPRTKKLEKKKGWKPPFIGASVVPYLMTTYITEFRIASWNQIIQNYSVLILADKLFSPIVALIDFVLPSWENKKEEGMMKIEENVNKSNPKKTPSSVENKSPEVDTSKESMINTIAGYLVRIFPSSKTEEKEDSTKKFLASEFELVTNVSKSISELIVYIKKAYDDAKQELEEDQKLLDKINKTLKALSDKLKDISKNMGSHRQRDLASRIQKHHSELYQAKESLEDHMNRQKERLTKTNFDLDGIKDTAIKEMNQVQEKTIKASSQPVKIDWENSIKEMGKTIADLNTTSSAVQLRKDVQNVRHIIHKKITNPTLNEALQKLEAINLNKSVAKQSQQIRVKAKELKEHLNKMKELAAKAGNENMGKTKDEVLQELKAGAEVKKKELQQLLQDLQRKETEDKGKK